MANRFLSNITINDSYTLPSSDGTNGQIITTDGSGNLSFNDTTSLYGTKSNYVYYDVKNSSGSTINKGTAVMASGTDGNSGHILIAPMVADGTVEAKYFMGVLESTLANGEVGRVIHFGELDQFNTSTFTNGDVLWCDPANPGGFTTTEPEGPNLKLAAAIVINAATNGKIKVRVQGNPGLHELHDVNISSVADGDLLQWTGTPGVWTNTTLASIADARYVNVSGDTMTGDLTISKDNPRLLFNDEGLGMGLRYDGGIFYIDPVSSVDRDVKITNSGGGNIELIVDGKLGIKTSTPTAALEVLGTNFTITQDYYKHAYVQSVGRGIAVVGNESVIDVVGEDTGNHSASIMLRGWNSGFGFINDAAENYLTLRYFEASSDDFSIHGGGQSVSTLTEIARFKTDGDVNFLNKVGIGTDSPNEELDVKTSAFSSISVTTERKADNDEIGSFAFYAGNNATPTETMWYGRMRGRIISATDGAETGSIYFQTLNEGVGVIPLEINGNITTSNYRIDAPTLHIGSSASLADGTNPEISTVTIYATNKVVTPKLTFLNDAVADDNYITCSDTNTAYSVNGENMGAWYEFVGDKLAADTANSAGIVASGLLVNQIEAENITMGGSTVLTEITGQTDPKYLRSDEDDIATGTITFENGIRVGTGSHGTSANRASITFGEGSPTSDSMYIEYDGEGLGGDNNSLYIGRTDTASDLARFTYGGDIELTSNAWSIGAGGTFITSGNVGIGVASTSEKLTVGGDVQINGTGGTIGNSGSIDDAFLKIGNDLGFDPNQILFIGSGYINAGSDLLLSGGGLGTADTLVLKANGNVGIGTGTSAPSAKLHVVGSTLIDSGSLTVSSASYTQIAVDQTDSAAINMGISSGSTEGFLNVINNGDNHLTDSPELKFLLNSTRYATLTTTGLGIGTDNPGYKFHLLADTTNNQFVLERTGTATGKYKLYTNNNSLWFYDEAQSSHRMMINSIGQVGIGTTAPSAKLDVQGSLNGELTLVKLGNTFDDNDPLSAPLVSMFMNAASNNGYLRVYGAPANNADKHRFDIGSTAGTSFMTFSPDNSEKMRITAGGLVGIGTSTPDTLLHIQGSDEQWLFVESTTSGAENGIRLQTSTGSRQNALYRNTATNLLTLRAGTDDGEIAFIAAGSTNEMMRLDGTGLGIGTTSPSQKLHVVGNIYATGIAQASTAVMKTYDGYAMFGSNSSTVPVAIGRDAATLDITIDTSGNVGIQNGHIKMEEEHYVNFRFEIPDNANPEQYILLCRNSGGNDVNGTITMDRTSGLRHACRVDILISSGSSALPVAGLRAFGVTGSGDPEYKLTKVTYGGVEYIALYIYNTDAYYESSGAYFTGRIVSTGEKLLPLLPSEITSPSDYENNAEHVFQGNAGFRDGNLGVGTTNPSDRLEVIGTGKFGEDADVTVSSVLKLRDSGDTMIAAVRTGVRTWAHNIYADGHYCIRNIDGSNNTLTLSDDNRVGINRDDPTYTLDVNGTCRIGGASQGTEFRIEATDTAGAPAATATIRMVGYEGRGIGTFYQDVSYAGEWFSGLRYNGGFGTYHIGFDETGGQAEYSANSKLSVGKDGKVLMPGTLGVGTTNPQARLHVIAPSSSTDEVFQEWSYTDTTQDQYALMLKQTVTSGVVRYNFSMVNNNTAYNDVLVLDRGKVGIGSTNPAEKLEVIGNIQAYQGAGNSAKIRLNVGTAGSPQVELSDNAGDQYWAVGADDADNFFKIHGSTTSMPTINSISTGAFLTINQAGTLTMTGDVIAYSDERLKENVQTIDGALDKVLSMRGVYYNRTDLEDKRRKVGVIAQEVEKVLPEVVSRYSKDDDTRAVDYGKMVGVLIEAIKEQQKQIEELKDIINKK